MRSVRLITVFILTGLICPSAFALNVEYVNSILWTEIRDVKVVDTLAYCAFANGLVILDVSDRASQAFKNNYKMQDITIETRLKYHPLEGNLIDISDSLSHYYVGKYYTQASTKAIDISGNHVYLADGDYGLKIIDVTDPSAPSLTGSFDTPGCEGVYVDGNYAYIASNGLLIIDISDPSAPSLAGSCNTRGGALDVFVSDNYAYLAAGRYGLHIIDISDPSTPSLAGSYGPSVLLLTGRYDISDWAFSVYVSGNYAYIASNGLLIIDISDSHTPSFVSSCESQEWAYDIFVSGSYAYLADRNSDLQIFDVSDPFVPSLAYSHFTGIAMDVYIAGDCAYVAYPSGLQIMDVSKPSAPSTKRGFYTLGNIRGAYVTDGYAYVVDGDLRIIDISNPSAPSLIGSFETRGYAQDVCVIDDFAYIADAFSGLQIINVSDPSMPSLTGSFEFDTTNNAKGIYVIDTYAYLADWSGLKIFEVSDPSLPLLIGKFDYDTMNHSIWDFYVSGGFAYIAAGPSGLYIVDVSDPSAPSLVGGYDPLGSVRNVYVAGSYAYLAAGDLQIIDISEPSVPSIKCSYTITKYYRSSLAEGVYVVGDHAYVAAGNAGLQIVDVSNPSAPSLIGNYNTPGFAWNTIVSGDYAYVADEASLIILDLNRAALRK